MPNIRYEIIPLSEENITLLEQIRYDAYGIDPKNFPLEPTFYATELKKGKYFVIGCMNNNQLLGACYTSKAHNSLYIEQLFIKKKYQKSKLHLGTNLLKFVLNNKKKIETYFETNFYCSCLDCYKNTSHFYQALGYKEKYPFMKKRLPNIK